MDEQLTERQRAIRSIEKQLTKAAKSKHFVESEEGQYVLSYITELVSGFTNQLISTRKEHEEYVEIRAKIDVLRKLKQVLEVQANEQAIAQLNDQLDLAQSEE